MKLERKSQDRNVVFQQRTTAFIIFSCLLILLVFVCVLSIIGYPEVAETLAENIPDTLAIALLGGGTLSIHIIFIFRKETAATKLQKRKLRKKEKGARKGRLT